MAHLCRCRELGFFPRDYSYRASNSSKLSEQNDSATQTPGARHDSTLLNADTDDIGGNVSSAAYSRGTFDYSTVMHIYEPEIAAVSGCESFLRVARIQPHSTPQMKDQSNESEAVSALRKESHDNRCSHSTPEDSFLSSLAAAKASPLPQGRYAYFFVASDRQTAQAACTTSYLLEQIRRETTRVQAGAVVEKVAMGSGEEAVLMLRSCKQFEVVLDDSVTNLSRPCGPLTSVDRNCATKLAAFGLAPLNQYDRVIYLDSDIVVLKNLDHLFGMPKKYVVIASAAYWIKPKLNWANAGARNKWLSGAMFAVIPSESLYDSVKRLWNDKSWPGYEDPMGGTEEVDGARKTEMELLNGIYNPDNQRLQSIPRYDTDENEMVLPASYMVLSGHFGRECLKQAQTSILQRAKECAFPSGNFDEVAVVHFSWPSKPWQMAENQFMNEFNSLFQPRLRQWFAAWNFIRNKHSLSMSYSQVLNESQSEEREVDESQAGAKMAYESNAAFQRTGGGKWSVDLLKKLSNVEFELPEIPRSKVECKPSLAVCAPSDIDDSQFVMRLLESVASQTCTPTEVLVVISGVGEHEPTALLDEVRSTYGSRMPLRIMLDPEKRTAGYNRNRCASNSNSEIISFIDMDDFMHTRRLELLSYTFAQYHPRAVVHAYEERSKTQCVTAWKSIIQQQLATSCPIVD